MKHSVIKNLFLLKQLFRLLVCPSSHRDVYSLRPPKHTQVENQIYNVYAQVFEENSSKAGYAYLHTPAKDEYIFARFERQDFFWNYTKLSTQEEIEIAFEYLWRYLPLKNTEGLLFQQWPNSEIQTQASNDSEQRLITESIQ